MKHLLRPFILFSFGLLISGCIEMHTVIIVNKDGSGLVEENILIGKEIINMFKEFASAFADSTQPQQEFKMFEEEKIKAKASELGEGIEFVSMENIVTDEKEGYTAIYKFKDINKVKVNQDPSDEVPMADQEPGSETNNEFVYFKFTKGKPNRLEFTLPEGKKEEKSVDTTKTDEITKSEMPPDSAEVEKMIKIMKDMKAKIEIKIDGEITSTNATHVDGNTITLFDIDFGQLISDKEKFEEFKKVNPDSFEEVKKLLKDIPGIKIELNNEVFVEFE